MLKQTVQAQAQAQAQAQTLHLALLPQWQCRCAPTHCLQAHMTHSRDSNFCSD